MKKWCLTALALTLALASSAMQHRPGQPDARSSEQLSISCDLECDLLAAKYGWSAAMLAQCHNNCAAGNGPCPLPPEDCEPDVPEFAAAECGGGE